MLIDHIGMTVSNFDIGKACYLEVLAPLDVELFAENQGWVGFRKNGEADCWFSPDEKIHPLMHIAFVAESREKVGLFYQSAIEAVCHAFYQ